MKNFSEPLQSGKLTQEQALEIFDQLPIAEADFMTGHWRGRELITGHPMEGLLEASGWYGKSFFDPENVHPLVFGSRQKKFSGKPRLLFRLSVLPVPKFLIRPLMLLIRPLIQTRSSKARLRMMTYRGKVSATMIYDDLPICDTFRKITDRQVMGLMDRKGMEKPYFFILEKED